MQLINKLVNIVKQSQNSLMTNISFLISNTAAYNKFFKRIVLYCIANKSIRKIREITISRTPRSRAGLVEKNLINKIQLKQIKMEAK